MSGEHPKLGHFPPPDFPLVLRGLAALSRFVAQPVLSVVPAASTVA